MIFNISRYLSAITNKFMDLSTEYAEDLFLFDSILKYCDLEIDTSNTYFSRLKNNNSEVDGAIRDAIQREDVIKHVVEYFVSKVVPKLNPHTGLDSCTNIIRFMHEDSTMNEKTRNKYVEYYDREQYGEFLAYAFLYSLSRQNKIKKISNPENIDNTTQNILLSKMNNIEMLVSKSFINIDSELSLSLSNRYDLSYTAKRKEDAFRIIINVAAESIPKECDDFKSLLDFIVFSGKTVSLKICDITVNDCYGNRIDYTFNSLMVGETITLPVIHSMRYDRSDFRSCPAELTIKYLNNTKALEIRNEYGDIILPFMNYDIEREKDKDTISAHFVTYDHDELIIGLHFQRPKGECKISEHQISITVTLKRPHNVKCNLQYYNLLIKLKEATGLSFFQKDGTSTSEFVCAQGFTPTYKDGIFIEPRDYLNLFKEIYFVENSLGIEFDISDFSKENIFHAQLLYRLIKHKNARTRDLILTLDYDPTLFNGISIENLKELPLMFDSELSSITVFNQIIELGDKYHMRWFSKDISLLPDNKARVKAYVAVYYEVGRFSEEELQAYGIDE